MFYRYLSNAFPVMWIPVFNLIGAAIGLIWGQLGLLLGMSIGMMMGAATLPLAILFAGRANQFWKQAEKLDQRSPDAL